MAAAGAAPPRSCRRMLQQVTYILTPTSDLHSFHSWVLSWSSGSEWVHASLVCPGLPGPDVCPQAVGMTTAWNSFWRLAHSRYVAKGMPLLRKLRVMLWGQHAMVLKPCWPLTLPAYPTGARRRPGQHSPTSRSMGKRAGMRR